MPKHCKAVDKISVFTMELLILTQLNYIYNVLNGYTYTCVTTNK